MAVGVVRRLGVFGGTFDPVHNGHISIAVRAGEDLALDEVIFIPAGQPRLKDRDLSTAPHHRLRMVELAIAGYPPFSCSDMEIRRTGPTYTADTLDRLSEERTGSALFMLAGLDSLAKFHRWGRPADILQKATIVGVPRRGFERLDRAVFEKVAPGAADSPVTLMGPMTDISSTEIRKRVSRGLSIGNLVPGAVARYIRENRLYAQVETCQ